MHLASLLDILRCPSLQLFSIIIIHATAELSHYARHLLRSFPAACDGRRGPDPRHAFTTVISFEQLKVTDGKVQPLDTRSWIIVKLCIGL